MSHTNKTPNYELPQFIGTDKASWLGDLNPAFLAIDTGMQANKVSAQAAEVSAGEASALAQSANSVANSANSAANNALDKIDGWVLIPPSNPDPTNFTTYSCNLWLNKGLNIMSAFCVIGIKDGFKPNFAVNKGTVLINLPAEHFKDNAISNLYFSGHTIVAPSTGSNYTTIPQFQLYNGTIRLSAANQPIPSSDQVKFIVLSRVFYVGGWIV